MLSEEEEGILAEASDVLSSPSNTFGMLNNADMEFPEITDENGEKVQLTHGNYITFWKARTAMSAARHSRPFMKHTAALKHASFHAQRSCEKDNFMRRLNIINRRGKLPCRATAFLKKSTTILSARSTSISRFFTAMLRLEKSA